MRSSYVLVAFVVLAAITVFYKLTNGKSAAEMSDLEKEQEMDRELGEESTNMEAASFKPPMNQNVHNKPKTLSPKGEPVPEAERVTTARAETTATTTTTEEITTTTMKQPDAQPSTGNAPAAAAPSRRPNVHIARPPKKKDFAFAKPWMQPDEIVALHELVNGEMQYLEWGTGGSTFSYADKTAHAHSIEHNEDWCKTVTDKLKELEITNVDFHCVPVQQGYMGWGGGFEEGTYDQFEKYILKIHSLGIAKHSLDVVLVDGRARVPCALTAIPYIKPNGIAIIHDFSWRPYYHGVLKYYDVVRKVNTLVILRPKPEYSASPPSAEEIRRVSPTTF